MLLSIDLKIILFLIYFYFTKQIKIYLITFFFVIIHELAHLIMGIFLKRRVKKITLMPIGLSIEFYKIKNYSKKTELENLIIAIFGPMLNIIILLIIKLVNINNELLNIIFYSNLFIALFNLIPIYPLDGGRILKTILKIFLKEKKAEKYINFISVISYICICSLSIITFYYIKNFQIFFVLAYIGGVLITEKRQKKIKKKINEKLNIYKKT